MDLTIEGKKLLIINFEELQHVRIWIKEEDKNEFVTRLPLYSSRMTGYKWICSECWDKAYRSLHHQSNKLNNNDKPSDKEW
ncbi:MAG TPA: hypothetical protein VJ729_03085 [Nitrososphaeraceae archaeon]|nr:hypothetical protein [Nitrososphaeraceae archaeon]